jgi:gliding motility-associated lipoprotein GldD
MKKNIFRFILLVTFIVIFTSCHREYTPKPHGYLRIDFPEKKYRLFDTTFPYRFEYPIYAVIEDLSKMKEPFFINVSIPTYQVKLHVSYKKINRNLATYLEDSRTFAYKHAIKATSINEKNYIDENRKVYGTLYEIEGNAASTIQFFMTDCTKNFIRGALYFYTQPDYDSLLPAIDFFKKDILHMIETLEWKKN